MLHLGLKYGQIWDTKNLGQVFPSFHPVKQTHRGEGGVQKKGGMDRGTKWAAEEERDGKDR